MTAREAFEKLNPVPEGVGWIAQDYNCYMATKAGYSPVANQYVGKWHLWQSLYPQIEAGIRLREAMQVLLDAKVFGEITLLCREGESDRECYSRCMNEIVKSAEEAISGFDAVGVR